MARRTRTGLDERKVRLLAHEMVDRVGGLAAGDRLAAAVEALEKVPNDAVRRIILETAVSAPDDVTAAFVHAAVRCGSTPVARAAADLLLDIDGAENALEIISECLEFGDSSVRRRAAEALETLSDPGVVDLLTKALGHEDDSVRRAATNTAGLVIGGKYHPLRQAVLGDPGSELGRTIVGTGDVQMRREIAQSLGYAGSDLVLGVLERCSADSDVLVRREAALALAALGMDGAAEALRRHMVDEDHVVAASVLDALARHYGRDSAKMLEVIRAAMKHPGVEVRQHAILMLDHFAPSRIGGVLAEAARDDDFEVQRSAYEIMRRKLPDARRNWLAASEAELSRGEQTLLIWEAGSAAAETGGAGSRAKRDLASRADVITLLERAALEGDESLRVHALSELLELKDIADSEALRRAVTDENESVRSRAGSALAYTRDATLLVGVLQRHSDPLLRRRACEALIDDPTGRADGGPPQRSVRFTSTRTVGTELFGHFLAALNDPDQGVKLLVCEAIRRYVEFRCPVPARVVTDGLRELSEDEGFSSLVRDTAREVADEVAEAALGGPLVKCADALLEWRGRLAREAHALRSDEQGRLALSSGSGLDVPELLGRWPSDFGLTGEQSLALAQALTAGAALPEEVGTAVMRGMVRGLTGCLEAICHAAVGVGQMGEERWRPHLEKWAQAVQGGPQLDWGEGEEVAGWRRLLARMRRQAAIAVALALEGLKDDRDPAVLVDECADADDWVRMAALTARAELRCALDGDGDLLASLCREHAEEAEFLDVVGPAAVALVGAGREEFVTVLESVLERAHTDLRYELTQRLMIAAGKEGAVRGLSERLTSGPVAGLGRFCLALALRGAGGSVEGMDFPDAPPGADVERTCALDGLRAMQGDEEAVERLESAVRGEDYRARYCSAVYLGLARVHSALPIFAGVSDRDAPFPLRSLCAGMLILGGHRQGVSWFTKIGPHARGADVARIVTDFGRAVEHMMPLMLDCKDVNLGRFV